MIRFIDLCSVCLLNCVSTHHLPIMDVVSAGVSLSPGGEVCQSGNGALEVILLDTIECW